MKKNAFTLFKRTYKGEDTLQLNYRDKKINALGLA